MEDELQHSLNGIKETIKSSSNLQVIKDSLSSASSLLLSSSSSPLISNNTIWEQAYTQFTLFLLNNVFVDWVSCFTSRERETLFDIFFINSPSPITTFLTLTSYAFSPKEQFEDKTENAFVLEYVVEVVTKYFIQQDYITKLITEGIYMESERNKHTNNSKTIKLDARWDRIVTLIGSLPERFSNRLEGKTSDFLLPDVVKQLIVISKELDNIRNDLVTHILSLFWGKISKVGHALSISREILNWQRNSQESKKKQKEREIIREILSKVPPTSLETILDTLLRIVPHCYSPDQFSEAFVDIFYPLYTNNTTFSFLLEKFLTNKVFSKKTYTYLLYLVSELSDKQSGGVTNDSFVLKTTVTMATTWSDTKFVLNSTIRIHRPRAIQFFIAKMNRELIEQHLLPRLVKGVQAHMQSPQREIRVLGMKTAENFSYVLSPEKPLSFEEDLSDPDDDFDDLLPLNPSISFSVFANHEEKEVIEEKAGENIQGDKERKKEKKKVRWDPDEVVGEEIEEEDNLNGETYGKIDSDDDDDLQPYNLDDDMSDLYPNSRQFYLRDCLTIFQIPSEKLDVDKFKGAVTSIERIIRAKPDDLDEVSEQLARSLLRTRNEFADEEFAEDRKKALVALAVFSTEIVVTFLGRQFYETNYSLSQRLLMLDVLIDAAKEMSTITETFVQKVNTPGDLHLVGKVTRKGTINPKILNSQSISFHAYSNLFFYPLMAKFDNKGNSFNMLGEDSIVLGRLIFSLGTFMSCSRNSPNIRQLSRDLFGFLWALRLHKQALVRQAVLFAIAQIVNVVPSFVLVEDLNPFLDDIQAWLYGVLHSSPDEQSKQLAQGLALSLVNAMQTFNPPVISEA